MSQILYDNLSDKLIETVPELRSEYESELKWWGDEKPGPHVIFGDVLAPHIIRLLESGTQEESLRRIFGFLEELANHQDRRIQEVVMMTICERLGDHKKWLEKARRYMGETTLHFSHEIEAFWGREPKNPIR